MTTEEGIWATIAAPLVTAVIWGIRRLFAQNDGILTRLSDRHIAFVDRVENVVTTQADTLNSLATSMHVSEENIKLQTELMREMVVTQKIETAAFREMQDKIHKHEEKSNG